MGISICRLLCASALGGWRYKETTNRLYGWIGKAGADKRITEGTEEDGTTRKYQRADILTPEGNCLPAERA
jgi:hypothetical protein